MRGHRPNARGRATIQAVEQAALALTENGSIENITVAAICERAGVSERVFFNHFPSREDAFLGLDLPAIDDTWARLYIEDDAIPLLTGAVRLVVLPSTGASDVAVARQLLIARSPALLARAHELLTPIRARCVEIVERAVEHRRPDIPADEVATIARVVVAAAAELLPSSTRPNSSDGVRKVWDIML